MKNIIIIILIVFSSILNAQNVDPLLLSKPWRAYWISVPNQSSTDFGVYLFRKNIVLKEKPDSYIVHVSADNRYKLYVNEKLVSIASNRGDLDHWYFETVDIAPYLEEGKNTIASIVWNEGENRAIAQISNATAFILQGNTAAEKEVNTNPSWQCKRDIGYSSKVQHVYGYYAVGPGELVDMNKVTVDWMKKDYDAGSWEKPQSIVPGMVKGVHSMISSPWSLLPSELPQSELKYERLLKTRKTSGVNIASKFPSIKADVIVPANTSASILLDQTYLTNSYPTVIFSKGKNASISLKYAEALYDDKMQKGNRNEIDNKTLIGRCDSIVSNGLSNQSYTPLSWRTYRYLQIDIVTHDESLTINDIYGTYTAYPFKYNAALTTPNPLYDNILKIGWRTARLCANETYMDCPFYERMQYIGDTRIQAMVSYFNSGDDRLARNAIDLLDYSRLPEGVTQSRYPSSVKNIIPPFSLLWIGMLSDYFHYRPDTNFVKERLSSVHQIITFFEKYQQADGSLKNLPYWGFTDWPENSTKWKFGAPPVGKDQNSSVLDLQLLLAYELAAEMEGELGLGELAQKYQESATLLKQTIQQKYWDESKGLFADTTEKDCFSQHANVLAILSETVKGEQAKLVLDKLSSDESITTASIYFKYYLNQALVKVGMGNDYINQLTIWKKNIALGMTTWGETSDVSGTRSDCHAWGSSPNIEFFRTILGIDAASSGFRTVKIEPHLGEIKKIAGSIPHFKGKISVSYDNVKKNNWEIEINLPDSVSGIFKWNNKEYEIKAGKNNLHF